MNSSLRKIIAGIFVMASTVCYAAVPQDSKFKAIVYDQNTKSFVAVGSTQTAAILAVSKDGRIWTPHNILGLGGNWESVNEISINNDGDIYLVDSVGDIFIAKKALRNNNWNFRKIPSNMENQNIVGAPFLVKYSESSEQAKAGLVMSIFYLTRLDSSDLKQIIRVDYTSQDGTTYSKTSHVIKSAPNIDEIGVSYEPYYSTVSLRYGDDNSNHFLSVNGKPFGQIIYSKLGPYKLNEAPKTARGMEWTTQIGTSILETVIIPGEPPYLCNIENPSLSSTEFCAPLPFPPAFLSKPKSSGMLLGIAAVKRLIGIDDNSVSAVVAMNDISDGKGVAVIYGRFRGDGAFSYYGASSLLEVAPRTCTAGDGYTNLSLDKEPGGGVTTVVILGKDNKALLSTNGGTQWQIVNM